MAPRGKSKSKSKNNNTANNDGTSASNSTIAISPASSMPILAPVEENNISVLHNNPNIKSSDINILPFDGNPEHIEFFRSQILDIATIFQWSDLYTLNVARSKLTGKARDFYIQSHQAEPFTSVHDFFNRLLAFFPTSSVAQRICDLESFVALPDEPIQHLIHRLNISARKVYPSMPLESLNQVKFTKLIKILPENYRQSILQDRISDYDAAVAKATLIYQSMSQNNTLSQSSQNHTINIIQDKVNALQTSVDTITENKNQKHNNKDHQSKSSNRSRKTHFNRRPNFRRGHRFHNQFKFSHQTRFQKKKQNQDSQNTTSSQSTSSAVPCQFCLCFGHTARDCAFALFVLQGKQHQSSTSSMAIANHPN